MGFRHVLLVSASLLTPVAALPALSLGQEVPPQVENAKQSFVGQINASGVFVHSGAGQNYYSTSKLDKGTQVKVVGIKFDWLKIEPPDGSFSYVAQAFVERMGDGKRGRVTRPDLNVRAGSTLNDMKAIVQTKLDQGAEVEILGEKDEYFMIKPPAGAYLYVNKQYVDPVGPADGGTQVAQQTPADPVPPTADVKLPEQPVADQNGPTITTPTGGEMAAQPQTLAEDVPASQSTGVAPDAVAGGPSTQPAPATPTADAQFDQLEARFNEVSTQPILDQPIAELTGGYEALVKDPQLAESLRRTAEYRLKTLKVRAEAQQQFVELKKSQEAAAARSKALKAEQEELQEQIKKSEIKMYAAVGTLYTSSLQQGKQTMYRLGDPSTGRTVVYLRADDASKLAPFLGQFIGVKGEVVTDPQLSMRVITPTDIEAVDQNELYKKVAAQIVPPSMLPKTASTGAEAAE